jgi:FtsH-binding integral membrane protein
MSYTYDPNNFGGQAQLEKQDNSVFIRRTYTLFLYGMLGIVGAAVAGFNLLSPAMVLPLVVVNFIMMVAMGWFGWRRPTALTLPLFTIVSGLMLGVLAHFYAGVFLPASVLTVAAFTGLTAYVHTTKQDFSYLKGFLAIAFFTMLAGIAVGLFFHAAWFHVLLSAFGVLAFGGWILYDTSNIVNRKDQSMTPGEGALELLIDIVGLFRWILRLLDMFR